MNAKVMRYPLIYLSGCGDNSNLNKELWNLQKKTREIENRTIQYMYSWDQNSYENYLACGSYLDVKQETGASIDTYVYKKLIGQYSEFASGNFSATLRKAKQRYSNLKKDIQRGQISLPSYKADQPIIIRASNCDIHTDGTDFFIYCTMFSRDYCKEKEYNRVVFKIALHDQTQRAIIERVVSGEYSLGDCQLVFKPGLYGHTSDH